MKQLVLQDMNERDVIDFVDDLLIFSESEKQHLRMSTMFGSPRATFAVH